MLKIYTASGWPFRQEIAKLNVRLMDKCYDVVSTWIEAETGISTPEDYSVDAMRDVAQVCGCDILLAIMIDPDYTYRGTWTEIGMALALNKRIIIVCPGTAIKESNTKYTFSHHCMTNVFYWHPRIQRVQTFEEALSSLRG